MRARLAVGIATLAAASACKSIGSGVTDGALTQLAKRQSDITAMERAGIDTAVARLAVAMDSVVAVRIRSMLQDAAVGGRGITDSVATAITRQMQGEFRKTLNLLVADNIAAVRTGSKGLVDDVASRTALVLSTRFASTINSTVDSAAYHAMLGITRATRDSLRPLIDRIATDLRMQVGKSVEDTQKQVDPWFRQWAWRFAILGGVGLVGLGIVAWIAVRRRQATLNVLVDSIDEAGNPALKEEIRRSAGAREVKPWLDKYVAKRRKQAGRRIVSA